MKKVLIICDLFPPAFGPRMGYLCKYIREQGWEPIVLTEFIADNTFAFLANQCETVYINFYPSEKILLRKLQWLCTFVLDFCFGYKNIRFYKEAKKLIAKHHVDIVLCSSFQTFPLPAALKIATKYQLPLVTDIRDIIEQYTGNEFIKHRLPSIPFLNRPIFFLFKWKSLRDRNRVLQKSDQITTVSPWHVQILNQYNPHTKLIYNGFDPELFYPQTIKTNRFIITYTGRLLSTSMRNPELLFKALKILAAENFFNEQTCRVHWFVDEVSQQIIIEEAQQYGILSFMDFKGYIPASAIPTVLNKSSILLLLTNKSEGSGPKGVMTTKFFEALAVEKPILCVQSDESYLAEEIQQTNAGLAAVNEYEVCDFLKHYYNEWKEKGYTTSAILKDRLKRFSREEQAKQFIQIFNRLTNHG